MLEVRRFEPSDQPDVWALHKQAMDAVGANFGSGPWNDDLDNIEAVYLNGRGDFLVGELQNRLVAMGAIRGIDESRAEIKRMRVLPEYQRLGYGQRIYDFLEARARDLGYTALVLDTLPRQKGARSFFSKNGYDQVGINEFQGEEQLLFQKRLS